MDKTPIDPEIEREAREIYRLILAGRDADAREHLMGLGSNRVAVAGAMIQLKCRWPARVTRLMDNAFCSLIVLTGLIVPVTVSIVVGQRRNWYYFSIDFVSYCLVAGVTIVVEFLLINSITSAFSAMPFVKERDRADRVKMEIARDALLAETEPRPVVIGALLNARTAFAANKEFDETVFDSPLRKHLDRSETSPELIAVLLEARSTTASNKDLDETIFDSELQKHLKTVDGAFELNESQKLSMLNCLESATWHLLEGEPDEEYYKSNPKRKIANVGIALAIVEFYQHHADESALDTLNCIAKCEPKQVSPKWRQVIEAARLVPGVKFVEVQCETEVGDTPITGTVYNVTRAFQVGQSDDEVPHYFLELADGSVLLMSGQYIYDIGHREYAGFIQSRFPSSKMIIRESDHEIYCTGEPLDYEVLSEEFWKVWGQGYAVDMTLFTDVTFDELWHIGDRIR